MKIEGAPADPFETETGPEPFAIGFEKSTGEAMVYGAVFFAVIFLAVSLATGQPLVALGALIAASVGFWHYPMFEKGQPQLGANLDGLFVDRIGFLDWASVGKLELSRTSVRSIRLVHLHITLNRPLADAVAKPQVFPFWKKLMMRSWSLDRSSQEAPVLRIELHPLTKDPDAVLDRIRRYRNV